jgi:hypothetical protein
MAWFTNGVLTNPAINTILADTGALTEAGGPVSTRVVVSSTVISAPIFELRNAADSANISSQALILAANTSLEIEFPVTWAAGERLRLRLNAAITGLIQASIITA